MLSIGRLTAFVFATKAVRHVCFFVGHKSGASCGSGSFAGSACYRVTAAVVNLVLQRQIREPTMQPKQQNSFTYDELISCAKGQMFGPGNPQLPMPPMLMCDRITNIDDTGGAFGKGQIDAELDIHPDLWFFPCHFEGDPVMPGCLGMDALWQLVGFFLGWSGGLGRGRALSVGEVKFTGQILPENKRVQFRLDIKRVIMRRLVMGIADGKVLCDGEVVFEANDIRVGLFTPEGN